MSKQLRKENGTALLLVVLRLIFGVEILNGGIEHWLQGQTVFAAIVGTETPIAAWVSANAALMWPLVSWSMILAGLSLIFGLLARLGSLAMFLFALTFAVGMLSWMGNLAMLGASIGFLIVGPGRYFGFDGYLLEKYKGLRPLLKVLG